MDKVNVGAILMLVVVAIGGLVWAQHAKAEDAYSKPFLAVCTSEQPIGLPDLLVKCSAALMKKCPDGVDIQWAKESPPEAAVSYIVSGVRCKLGAAPAQLEGSI